MAPLALPGLEKDCLTLMTQDLAPSTHRTYKSAQHCFTEFCSQLGRLHPNGSPRPADEWTLCLFATHLSSSLRSSSMKICSISAVRSMQLQRVLRGIKRTQGLSTCSSTHLTITDHHMLIIHGCPYALMSRTMLCFGLLPPWLTSGFPELPNSQSLYCLVSIHYFI